MLLSLPSSTALLLLGITACLPSTRASPVVKQRDSLQSCLSSASLTPVTLSSSSYAADAAAFNQRLQPAPSAIVYPSTAAGVAKAVQCAASSSASVSARSGGHSYASYGLAGQLVIDLSNFKSVTVGNDGIAVIGTGNRLGDVALALNAKGRAVPHGTCPFVGIGGHAGYGGFGLPSRLWGLTLDTIVAYDAVLANGTILTNLTAQQDPDLFWALNGAAPSFAIVTAYHTRTFQAPASAINFAYSYPAGKLSSYQAASLFGAFQSFGASSAPAELGFTYTIGPGGTNEISGVYYGTQNEFQSVLGPFIASMPSGYSSSVKNLTWIQSVAALAGDQKLNTTSASDYRDDFSAKSLTTPQGSPINSNTLAGFFDYVYNTKTSTEWFIEVNLYGGNHSVIPQRSLNGSSFGRRDILLNFQIYASSPSYSPPYPAEGFNWLNGVYNSIAGPMAPIWGSSYGAYVNYIDPTLSAQQTKSLYWGTQYPRLAALKGKYDPAATFNFTQGIHASS